MGNQMGLTGLEPVTLRLSSACSNQLSYRPVRGCAARFSNVDGRFSILFRGALCAHLLKSAIANRKSKINGGKGIRTPDFQLAKLALYQLSYAPRGNCRISIDDFRLQGIKQNAGCRFLRIGIRPLCASSNGLSCVRALRKRSCLPLLPRYRQIRD
jgi:hypothetical protein